MIHLRFRFLVKERRLFADSMVDWSLSGRCVHSETSINLSSYAGWSRHWSDPNDWPPSATGNYTLRGD
jgi:hypothetical protein